MSRVYCRGWDNEDNCHSEFSVNIRTIVGGVFGERDSNVKRLIYIPSKHDMREARRQTHCMRHGLIHNVIGVSPNTFVRHVSIHNVVGETLHHIPVSKLTNQRAPYPSTGDVKGNTLITLCRRSRDQMSPNYL